MTADSFPTHIDGYRILRKIGEGGMGVVFEAEQDSPKRVVALKILHTGAMSAERVSRFQREVQLLGRLHHAGIAQIHDAGTFDSPTGAQPYFAMEYVQGQTLSGYAHQEKLPIRKRVELIAAVCDAVQHAHDQGVMHRDLKPGNILVDTQGHPKVLDFGLARAVDTEADIASLQTSVGQVMGTLQYMSPEQAAGDPEAVDVRTDVYSLGVILYEQLTGRLPYAMQGKPVHEALRIIREEEPTAASSVFRGFRGDIETILGRALEKEADRRYSSAAELAADLRRHLADEPILARKPSTMYQIRKFARRNRALVGGMVATFFALAAGLVGTTRGYFEASAAAERSHRIASVLTDVLGTVNPEVAQGQDTVLMQGILGNMAERLETELSDDPVVEFELRKTLGATYLSIGEHAAAEPQFQRALQIATAEWGESDRRALQLAGRIGSLRRFQGRLAEAEEIFDAVWVAMRDALGPDDEDTLHLRQQMAMLRLDERRLKEAEEIFLEVQDANLRLHGAEHVQSMVALRCLGVLYLYADRPDKAEPALEEALALSIEIHGERHPSTVTIRSNLASCYLKTDRRKAVELRRESLRQVRETYGAVHPRTLACMNSLAAALVEVGQLEEAEQIALDCIPAALRSLGSHHRITLMARYHLSKVKAAQRLTAQAVRLQEELIGDVVESLGEAHSLTLEVHRSLAHNLRAIGRADESIEHLRLILEEYVESFGEENATTLSSMSDLAVALSSSGQTQEAVRLLEQVVTTLRRVLPEDELARVVPLNALAYAYLMVGRPYDAERAAREAETLAHRTFGAQHPDALRCTGNLASALQRQGKSSAAFSRFILFVDGWLPAYGPQDANGRSMYRKALTELEKLDEPVPVETWQRARRVREAMEPEDLAFGARLTFLLAKAMLDGAEPDSDAAAEAEELLLEAYDADEAAEVVRSQAAVQLADLYERQGDPGLAEEWRARQ